MENKAKRMKTGEAKSNLNNEKDVEKPVWTCDYCQKEFSRSSGLKQHVKVHTGQKDFHCNLCDFSSSRKASLEAHIRRHLNEKNFKCPEMNCTASFVTSTGLKQHESNHNKNKKFLCSSCPYKTDFKLHLTRHMKNIHSELKPLKCPHENCEYSAKQQSNLNQHKEIHSLEKNHVCPHPNCGFKTNSSLLLKSHMKTHSTGEKRFNCHFCDYSSHQHTSLVLHIRRHTLETPFACQICSYKSKDKSHLIQHMKKHAE